MVRRVMDKTGDNTLFVLTEEEKKDMSQALKKAKSSMSHVLTERWRLVQPATCLCGGSYM